MVRRSLFAPTNWVNIGSDNDLSLFGIKPLSESTPIFQRRRSLGKVIQIHFNGVSGKHIRYVWNLEQVPMCYEAPVSGEEKYN